MIVTLNTSYGTTHINVFDISAITETRDRFEIHMNSGTIFTTVDKEGAFVFVTEWMKVMKK